MRNWLVVLRNNKKLSQYKVAELADISQSYYAAIELGQRGAPPHTAKKIAKVLEFDWTRFYE